MSKINSILLSFVFLPMVGCDFFKFKTAEEEKNNPVVATVDGNSLRHADLDFVTKETQGLADSTNLAKRYVQSWIKKQLMIKAASKNITISQAELDKKLLDYKYALIVYQFEKDYIEENLDREVSEEDIATYYQKNQENFTLKEIIVRSNFIKMEKTLSQNTQVERMLKRNEEDDRHKLRDLALKSATNYFLEDSTWIKFEDIIINTPLTETTNVVQLLQQNDFIKVEDDTYNYYFKILDFKLQDQVPPVEFVKDEISKIIINKRKVSLAEELQNQIYNRALENNEFKIYEQP
ncbi:peptidyl-prolyl cis-trans isomerase [Echinicola jeungdonensis]|uniref:Peptidyl-prolyl cis-trans isomerase n=1 Tax=Echinicola jeungdonensis TaxID=709343 RepID=A0ABV5J1S5_9BACT|nr:peptidyl-prolyl cis-trans isomerase [Echinicola jeungdonensis]MDN3668594.1 peptidyl-prolyl cis-trans isomerase [Echinicola jeungdonensis]